MAAVFERLGRRHMDAQQYDQAVELFTMQRNIHRDQTRDARAEGEACANLGVVHQQRGEYQARGSEPVYYWMFTCVSVCVCVCIFREGILATLSYSGVSQPIPVCVCVCVWGVCLYVPRGYVFVCA